MFSHELAEELGVECPQLFRVTESMRIPVILTLAAGVRCPHHGCAVYTIHDDNLARVRTAVIDHFRPRPPVEHHDPTPWRLREEPDAGEREELRRWGALEQTEEAR